MTIEEICNSFNLGGQYISCSEIKTGNINHTFKVNFIRDGLKKGYVVQRINRNVFANPEEVMDNIVRISNYIHDNVVKCGLSTVKNVVHVFQTVEGKPYIVDENGDFWRCYRFVPNAITYDATDNLEIIENAGMAFGRFQRLLDGFDAKSLYTTIPNFHNTIVRYADFKKAVALDPLKRVKKVQKEIDYLLSVENKATELQRMLDSGEIPLRVTHNDTKCNNVCFDKDTNEALSVLDLDTVMPGAVAHDFGDAIRFIANTAEEDCPDLSKVSLDLDKYEAFCKGFIGELCKSLTKKEFDNLNLGVFTLTCELATRFLSDYILGDKYFKVKYPGHNLDRARNQIALAKDIDKKKVLMDAILQKYV